MYRHYLRNAQVVASIQMNLYRNGWWFTLSVITGLAVGIGFVVVFSIFFTSSLMKSDDSNSAVTLGEAGHTISVDFGVALPERDMIVKKGETVRVPVTIETLGNVEKVLSLSIMPYTFGGMDSGQLFTVTIQNK
jgi:hypothetical protein